MVGGASRAMAFVWVDEQETAHVEGEGGLENVLGSEEDAGNLLNFSKQKTTSWHI